MSTIRITDNYSNGIEGFNVIAEDATEFVLYTSTGVRFLNAGKDDKITIEKRALESFLGREMSAFKIVNN